AEAFADADPDIARQYSFGERTGISLHRRWRRRKRCREFGERRKRLPVRVPRRLRQRLVVRAALGDPLPDLFGGYRAILLLIGPEDLEHEVRFPGIVVTVKRGEASSRARRSRPTGGWRRLRRRI